MSSPRTQNFVALMPARVTRFTETASRSIDKLPSERRISSSGTPASINAPTTISPDAPEKQSKYRTFTTQPSYQCPTLNAQCSTDQRRWAFCIEHRVGYCQKLFDPRGQPPCLHERK